MHGVKLSNFYRWRIDIPTTFCKIGADVLQAAVAPVLW